MTDLAGSPQASSQTDLENWVTAIHSASASLLARRQGKEDTLRLLGCQSRALLRRIDTDAKMKKMAELQLSIIKEPKSRKAVESQVGGGGATRSCLLSTVRRLSVCQQDYTNTSKMDD